jgi:hypothetical protein
MSSWLPPVCKILISGPAAVHAIRGVQPAYPNNSETISRQGKLLSIPKSETLCTDPYNFPAWYNPKNYFVCVIVLTEMLLLMMRDLYFVAHPNKINHSTRWGYM